MQPGEKAKVGYSRSEQSRQNRLWISHVCPSIAQAHNITRLLRLAPAVANALRMSSQFSLSPDELSPGVPARFSRPVFRTGSGQIGTCLRSAPVRVYQSTSATPPARGDGTDVLPRPGTNPTPCPPAASLRTKRGTAMQVGQLRTSKHRSAQPDGVPQCLCPGTQG